MLSFFDSWETEEWLPALLCPSVAKRGLFFSLSCANMKKRLLSAR